MMKGKLYDDDLDDDDPCDDQTTKGLRTVVLFLRSCFPLPSIQDLFSKRGTSFSYPGRREDREKENLELSITI